MWWHYLYWMFGRELLLSFCHFVTFIDNEMQIGLSLRFSRNFLYSILESFFSVCFWFFVFSLIRFVRFPFGLELMLTLFVS